VQRAPVAGGTKPDLWPSEEKLPAAQAGSGHARDAPGDRGRSQSCLTGIRLYWTIEHGFYRAGESDGPAWGGSARTPHVGDGSAITTPAGSRGVVACVLSFRAPPPITTNGAGAASRARRQTSGATLSATDSSDGSGQNEPAMDGTRGARLPLAAGFRLSATEAKCGCWVMSRGEE
jgi:hypothetical protein